MNSFTRPRRTFIKQEALRRLLHLPTLEGQCASFGSSNQSPYKNQHIVSNNNFDITTHSYLRPWFSTQLTTTY